MKLKSPEGITDISVAGVNYQPDADGIFDVDDAHVGHLFQFGFVSAEAPAQPAPQAEQEPKQPAPEAVAAPAADESAEAPAQRKKK